MKKGHKIDRGFKGGFLDILCDTRRIYTRLAELALPGVQNA